MICDINAAFRNILATKQCLTINSGQALRLRVF